MKTGRENETTKRWQLKMTTPLEVGISTVDIEQMIRFYTEVLGLKLIADNKVAPEMSTLTGATPSGYRIVRLQTPFGERVKFVQTGNPTPVTKRPRYVMERQGLAYLTFVIADLDTTIERLKEHHVMLLSEGRKVEVRSGVFAIYAIDPEGNFIEFVEYRDVQAYRPDLCQKS